MRVSSLPLTPELCPLCSRSPFRSSQFRSQNHGNFSLPICRYSSIDAFYVLLSSGRSSAPRFWDFKRRRRNFVARASRIESPYELLGVSPSASADEIKRAYRKLALKYHPDVNKEANAQEKFMRIKHAYNTLMNSESRRKYDSGSRGSDFSYSTAHRSRVSQEEEEFYGFEDFFRDLQEEFKNWEENSSKGKPKSLWEELAEIGEEFVEFLEKELNVSDTKTETYNYNTGPQNHNPSGSPGTEKTEARKGGSIEDDIDEIEATLVRLKKELGL